MITKHLDTPLIVPQPICDLSLDERGLLSTMANLPEADYVNIKQLSEITNTSKPRLSRIIESLVNKGYVLFLDNVYAVNKLKIKDMLLITPDTNGGDCECPS